MFNVRFLVVLNSHLKMVFSAVCSRPLLIYSSDRAIRSVVPIATGLIWNNHTFASNANSCTTIPTREEPSTAANAKPVITTTTITMSIIFSARAEMFRLKHLVRQYFFI